MLHDETFCKRLGDVDEVIMFVFEMGLEGSKNALFKEDCFNILSYTTPN